MSPTVYVVTGGGRGIGFTLVQELAARPNTIVFAGVRTLPKADDQLSQLAAKLPEVVFPIQITSADEADNAAAAELIKAKVGKVDVIIANAGVSSGSATSLTITLQQLRADFEINTIGPAILYKSFAPLLLAANEATPGSAKFIVVSSLLGQIADAIPWSYNAYGASKAAVNFLVKKIDQETPGVIAFPIHPGMVATDMGRSGIEALGMTVESIGAITPLQSAQGILGVVDKATKESHGGKFWDEKGVQVTY